MSLFKFKLIITMLFIYGSGGQRINRNKKCRQIAGNFDCHADAVVRNGVHRPMEHTQGFNQNCQQFAFILGCGQFVVAHNHS